MVLWLSGRPVGEMVAFRTGTLINDAPRQDVVSVMDDTGVPDVSDDDSDGLQNPVAEAEAMRNAR